MQAHGLEILLDDDCLLAINKPSGLPTQAPRQYDSVERRIRAWFEELHGPGAYLGLPHRIDRPASGALLLAKTPRAARLISRQFERRQIEKAYWALVGGNVDPPHGIWRDFVRKLPSVPKVDIVAADAPGAVEAVLEYQVAGQTSFGSWLEIKLQTGRTHQIRIQAASRGHSVLGDRLYGSTVPFGPQVADEREGAIALHARSLMFRHPTTGKPCTVTAHLPDVPGHVHISWRVIEYRNEYPGGFGEKIMASITIEVPQKLKLALDELARKDGVATEDVVEQAINDHLFIRQFRSMREQMTAKARGQGVVTDEDVFDRVS